MSKEQYKQKTIAIDFTDIMSDPGALQQVQKDDNLLQSFIAETDNPALIELEKLFEQDPSLTIEDERVSDIVKILEEQLKTFDLSIAFDDKTRSISDLLDLSLNFGGSSSSTPKHLAFVYHALKRERSLSDVINGYGEGNDRKVGVAERFSSQFTKDVNRIPFKLVDQHGNVIEEKINDRIYKAISGTAQHDNDKDPFIKMLQKEVGMTDGQLALIKRSYTQRCIIGVGAALAGSADCKQPSTTNREDILHVHRSEDGTLTLRAIEYKERVSKYKIDKNGHLVLDAEEQKIESSLFDISYKLSLEDAYNLPERIVTITSLCPEGEVKLPKTLQERVQSKTISIEIGDVLFDPIVLEGMQKLPEDSQLKSALLNNPNPVFHKLEEIRRAGKELTPKDRTALKDMIAVQLAPEDMTISHKETGDSQSDMKTHLHFIYQALDDGGDIEEIINGYTIQNLQTDKTITHVGLEDRFKGQFTEDFLRPRPKIVDEMGKSYSLESKDLEGVIKELKTKYHMTEAQLQYLISEDNQRSNRGIATIFHDGTHNFAAERDSLDVTFKVKKGSDGQFSLQAIGYKSIAGHYDLSDGRFIADSKLSLNVDISHLTDKHLGNESGFLPSQKVTKIVTYTPLHEEAEYSLPEFLEHRTVDRINLEKAITEQDHYKISHIIRTSPDKGVDKVIVNFIKQEIDKGKANSSSADDIQTKILGNLVGGDAIKRRTSPELNEKIELYLKHKTPDGLTKIVQFMKALVISAGQAKWISREEYKKQRLEEEVSAIKDTLKRSYTELKTNNTTSTTITPNKQRPQTI